MNNLHISLGKTIFANLLLRISILIITCFAIVFIVNDFLGREMAFTLIIGLILVLIQIKSLTDYALRINRSLVQFIDSVGSPENNGIRYKSGNSIMSDFELRINQLKEDISKSKMESQKQKFLLKIAIDELDYGLIFLKNRSEVIFTNKALQKLINGEKIDKFSDLEKIHPKLGSSLRKLNAGTSGTVNLREYRASIRCKEFKIGRDDISLFSIQNIQHEIDKNEIESWERLIKVLTHEIMNSLSPIISLSKSMQKSLNDTEKMATGLSAIEDTGEGLITFISEYRKLSNLPKPKKELLEVNYLFKQIKSLFNQECRQRNINLSVTMDQADLRIYADRFQIEQVLINLMRNSIEVLSQQKGGIINLYSRSFENILEIIVEDNGPGISDEIKDKIFIPFFSTKKKGIGIGLSISKQIITNHDASIHSESVSGMNTKFIIWFKIAL